MPFSFRRIGRALVESRARHSHQPLRQGTGGDTLRELWREYTGDPFRQALELAEDRRER